MILKITGIFILAFIAGYFAGGIPAKTKKRKAELEKKKKMANPPPQGKAEKLN
jgi:hypothetical protein